jgi:molecular chaperone DnaK
MSTTGKKYSAEEVSAFILARLKRDAELKLGCLVNKAIITVPAYFDDARRRATQDAGQIAGLDVLRIINEPTAAALAYGIDSGHFGEVLVYDLGGGTFDVTVMEISSGHLEVRFSGGDSQLGGLDWDNLLMQYLNKIAVDKGGASFLDDSKSLEALRARARPAKHALSTKDATTIYLPGTNGRVSLERRQFEAFTHGLLERTILKTEEVLENAGMSWGDIDRLLLVGGASRMPMVVDRLAEVSGKRPSHEVNPDEVVAVGAAMQGALLENKSDRPLVSPTGARLTNVRVEDVTAHSLGVEVVAGTDGKLVNAVVLPAGTKIPAEGRQIFYTMVGNQQIWECRVYQGEEESLEWVTLIGEGRLRLPGHYARNTPMEVTLAYDANSVVHLYLADGVAHQPLGELHIERRANLTPEAVRRKAIEAANTRLN